MALSLSCSGPLFSSVLHYFPTCLPSQPPYPLGPATASDVVAEFCAGVTPASDAANHCMTTPDLEDPTLNPVRVAIRDCFDILAPEDFSPYTAAGLTEDGVPACNPGEACRNFNDYMNDGRFQQLVSVCELDLSDAVTSKYFVTSAEATLDCQNAGGETCAYEGSDGCEWAVPVSSSALLSNAMLAYLLGGTDLVARMPGCVLPMDCGEQQQQQQQQQ